MRSSSLLAIVACVMLTAAHQLGAAPPPGSRDPLQSTRAQSTQPPGETWIGKAAKGTFLTFTAPESRFSLEYPRRDWMVIPGGGPIEATLATKQGDASITIEHAWLTQALAPSEITELFADLEIDLAKERNPRAVDFQSRVLETPDSRVVVVQYVRPGVTGMERVRQYSFPAGRHLYRLSCTAAVGVFLSHEAVFAHVMATFRATSTGD